MICKNGHEGELQLDSRGKTICRICRNEAVARYYERNREMVLEASAQYYQDNRESLSQKQRDRYDPDYAKERSALRRALQANQFVEHVNSGIVYAMHGGMCGICKVFVAEDEFEVDHVIPLSKGGLHGYINVQPAHMICNRRKGAKVLS